MTKYKSKVELHGKEMNLLEAKLYILGLNFGILKANLNEMEEREYVKALNLERNRSELAKKLVGKSVRKEPTKRDYLIKLLEKKIDSVKILKKMEYCREHGHKEKKGPAYTPPGFDSSIKYYTCLRCGTSYEQSKKKPEYKTPSQPINNPFRK